MPGYFIPQYNLLDTIPVQNLNYFVQYLQIIRRNPVECAVKFLSKMILYRNVSPRFSVKADLYIKRSSSNTIEPSAIFTRELKTQFLQNLLFSFDKSRNPVFWKKSVILNMFAKWCHAKIESKLAACYSEFVGCEKMALFDVVYLDLVHGFALPEELVLARFNKFTEESTNVMSTLVKLYCIHSSPGTQKVNRHFKDSLLILEIIRLFTLLISSLSEQYEEAEDILKSVYDDEVESNVFNDVSMIFHFDKQRKDIQEMQLVSKDDSPIYLSRRVYICYLTIKCCVELGRDCVDTKHAINDMEFRCSNLEAHQKYFNYHLLADVCQGLKQEISGHKAIRAALYWKTQLAVFKQGSGIKLCGFSEDNNIHINSKCMSIPLLYFQIILLTKQLALSTINPSTF